jgi:hypothetical protein
MASQPRAAPSMPTRATPNRTSCSRLACKISAGGQKRKRSLRLASKPRAAARTPLVATLPLSRAAGGSESGSRPAALGQPRLSFLTTRARAVSRRIGLGSPVYLHRALAPPADCRLVPRLDAARVAGGAANRSLYSPAWAVARLPKAGWALGSWTCPAECSKHAARSRAALTRLDAVSTSRNPLLETLARSFAFAPQCARRSQVESADTDTEIHPTTSIKTRTALTAAHVSAEATCS